MNPTKTPDFEGIRNLAAIVDGMPNNAFNLLFIIGNGGKTQLHPYGTSACALGVVCAHPDFAHKRVRFTRDLEVWVKGKIYYQWEFDSIGAIAFNITLGDSHRLFCRAREGIFGYGEPRGLTDKQRFRHRVIAFLEKHGQPVSEAYRHGKRG